MIAVEGDGDVLAGDAELAEAALDALGAPGVQAPAVLGVNQDLVEAIENNTDPEVAAALVG